MVWKQGDNLLRLDPTSKITKKIKKPDLSYPANKEKFMVGTTGFEPIKKEVTNSDKR